ncbi:Universal stress family protein [Candidatus Desulfosporosinus infrequens]|uniref:Universal stress family protein n=1 Tax=Candidatus Desulfosporosinus infrequens TaxID=2043169 RepID=A0A2U3LRT9_9FIRM|nr:Universal stress family protein [Candidatus Desulfosporosinus infrequens]
MNDSKFRVLLYSDGSYQAFSAAVYTATLLRDMPNMHLTIVQVQNSDESSQGTEFSWKELRPKYKRYYWGCSTGKDYRWIDTWPVSPTQEWMKHVLDESAEAKQLYAEILTKTNEIYAKRKLDVTYEELCANVSFSDTTDIADTVKVIVDYISKNTFELVIMGTRGHSALNGVIFGSLSHSVLDKSPIPVMLIKKLPQDFIDDYLSHTES